MVNNVLKNVKWRSITRFDMIIDNAGTFYLSAEQLPVLKLTLFALLFLCLVHRKWFPTINSLQVTMGVGSSNLTAKSVDIHCDLGWLESFPGITDNDALKNLNGVNSHLSQCSLQIERRVLSRRIMGWSRATYHLNAEYFETMVLTRVPNDFI